MAENKKKTTPQTQKSSQDQEKDEFMSRMGRWSDRSRSNWSWEKVNIVYVYVFALFSWSVPLVLNVNWNILIFCFFFYVFRDLLIEIWQLVHLLLRKNYWIKMPRFYIILLISIIIFLLLTFFLLSPLTR